MGASEMGLIPLLLEEKRIGAVAFSAVREGEAVVCARPHGARIVRRASANPARGSRDMSDFPCGTKVNSLGSCTFDHGRKVPLKALYEAR
jgi:hypothetical protein